MWRNKCQNDQHFIEMMKAKKERGHSIADYVEAKNAECIGNIFKIYFETEPPEYYKKDCKNGKRGDRKKAKRLDRSSGDCWISNDTDDIIIYDPLNSKTSVVLADGKISGRPNMLSLRRLLDLLIDGKINAYYLLIVKFSIDNQNIITPSIYFVNILDIIDYLEYDDGPGQLMLNNEKFYTNAHLIIKDNKSIKDKIMALNTKKLEATARLIENRKNDNEIRTNKILEYKEYSLEDIKIKQNTTMGFMQ